jgi:hypothetical protein
MNQPVPIILTKFPYRYKYIGGSRIINGVSKGKMYIIISMRPSDSPYNGLLEAVYMLLNLNGSFISYIGPKDVDECFKTMREVNLDTILDET